MQESWRLEETVPVDEAVKAYMETYEFTSEDLKSMYDSVRAVEQQADRRYCHRTFRDAADGFVWKSH